MADENGTDRMVGKSVTLPESMWDRLQELADDDKRTRNNLVRLLLEEALRARGEM